MKKHGCVVHLVCHAQGTVQAVRHVEAIRALRSYRAVDVYEQFLEGCAVKPTIDIRTDAGWVRLCHEDPAVLEADYSSVVHMMPTMFEVE